MQKTVKCGVYTYDKETLLEYADKILDVLASDRRISSSEFNFVAKVLDKKFGTENLIDKNRKKR